MSRVADSKLNQIEAHDVGNHNTNQSKLNIFSGANWKSVLRVQIEIAVRSHLSWLINKV